MTTNQVLAGVALILVSSRAALRGIVAAATASTFSAGLVSDGIGGASKILPVTFLVIVATVTLYGLTAAPVARRLGVVRLRPARTCFSWCRPTAN